MSDIFISSIEVNKVRNLSNLRIDISETERKHLILTGRNGTGKTSLLMALRDFVERYQYDISKLQRHIEENIRFFDKIQNVFNGKFSAEIIFNQTNKITTVDFHNTIFAFLSATRDLSMEIPKAIEKIKLENQTQIKEIFWRDFLKYMLFLDYQLATADHPGDKHRLKSWFDNFENALRDVYECKELKFWRDSKNLTFKIVMPGLEPFGLNEMADGYSAFLNIVLDLMMRMDNGDAVVDTERPAIVFIDEIETHLHVSLQKKVLPFLTRVFPNTQFIVTTHSPFVITSLENAVVFDLEKKERLENLSMYSYETIVEAYFDTNMYSEKIRKKLDRYKALALKQRTDDEKKEFLLLLAELKLVPEAAKEVYTDFNNFEAKRVEAENGENR